MPARRWWADAGWTAGDYMRRLIDNSAEDNVLFLAGGIAFNILLAAIPFALLVITGFTYALPKLMTVDPATAAHRFIGGFLPTQNGPGATLVYSLVDDVIRTRGKVTIYSAIVFLVVSTRLFTSLRTSLADVFDIEHERGLVRGTVFDVQITIVATALFAVSQVISGYLLLGTTRGLTVLTDLGLRKSLVGTFELWAGRALAFGIITLMFFALYKFLPVRRVRTRTAVLAAITSGLLFEIAKFVFRTVVVHVNMSSLYTGTIAALIIIVAWVYYAALVFLIGGEVGQVYELSRTRRLQTF